MRPRRYLVLLPAIMALLGGMLAVTPGAAAADTGWVRCANLSPDTPTAEAYADVYLYPFGNPAQPTVLRHVGYGDVSSYMPVSAGQYTVAMRPHGAPASSPPVVSVNFMVSAGANYTVTSIGPVNDRRLQVLTDQMAAPKGHALLRVFQASVKQPVVTVSAGRDLPARPLAFGSATSYQAVGPGPHTVVLSAPGEHASMSVTLPAGSVHTIVVLDGPSGLKIDPLTDAASSQQVPMGGAATGWGGTASGDSLPALVPWLATLAAGLLLMTAGGIGLRRARAS